MNQILTHLQSDQNTPVSKFKAGSIIRYDNFATYRLASDMEDYGHTWFAHASKWLTVEQKWSKVRDTDFFPDEKQSNIVLTDGPPLLAALHNIAGLTGSSDVVTLQLKLSWAVETAKQAIAKSEAA